MAGREEGEHVEYGESWDNGCTRRRVWRGPRVSGREPALVVSWGLRCKPAETRRVVCGCMPAERAMRLSRQADRPRERGEAAAAAARKRVLEAQVAKRDGRTGRNWVVWAEAVVGAAEVQQRGRRRVVCGGARVVRERELKQLQDGRSGVEESQGSADVVASGRE